MQNLILNWLALIRVSFSIILLEQFWTAGNSTPGPSEAEKLSDLGKNKKKLRLPPEGRFLEPIQKK